MNTLLWAGHIFNKLRICPRPRKISWRQLLEAASCDGTHVRWNTIMSFQWFAHWSRPIARQAKWATDRGQLGSSGILVPESGVCVATSLEIQRSPSFYLVVLCTWGYLQVVKTRTLADVRPRKNWPTSRRVVLTACEQTWDHTCMVYFPKLIWFLW